MLLHWLATKPAAVSSQLAHPRPGANRRFLDGVLGFVSVPEQEGRQLEGGREQWTAQYFESRRVTGGRIANRAVLHRPRHLDEDSTTPRARKVSDARKVRSYEKEPAEGRRAGYPVTKSAAPALFFTGAS
jgi:hypothetical protein